MVRFELLDFHDDILYTLCEAASVTHPPHWNFPALGEHGQQPDEDSSDLSERMFCLGWVHLSHVCRRLRNICLDSPASWAKVVLAFPSSSPDARDVPLARARDAHLMLKIPSVYHNARLDGHILKKYLKKVHYAKKHVHRAISLETTDGDAEPASDWRLTFNEQAYPTLTRLDIHQGPPSQLTINAPNLVSLRTKDALPLFPFSTTLLRALHLNLQLESGIGGGTRAEELVLNILRATPLLEELDLSLVVDKFAGEVQIADSPIVLEHLNAVAISVSRAVDLGLIWSAIRAPQDAFVALTVLGACHDKPALFRSIAPRMRCPDYVQLSLSLRQDFELVALQHIDEILLDSVNRSESLTFRPEKGDIFALDDTLEHLLMATDVEQIRFFHLITSKPFDTVASTPALFTFLGAFHAVTALTLNTDEYTTGPIYLLLTSGAASLLPSLNALVIKHDPLHEMDAMYGGSQSLVSAKAYWNAVVGFLKARKQVGKPISALLLYGAWPWQGSLGPKNWNTVDARAIKLAKTYVDELVDSRDVKKL